MVFSRQLALQPIRQAVGPGQPLTTAERIALTPWINRLWYSGSGPRVGWLKAVALPTLQKIHWNSNELQIIDRYFQGGDQDDRLRREVIRLFLHPWMTINVPKGLGIWRLAVDEFQPIPRVAALAVADEIMRVTLAAPAAILRGPLPSSVSGEADLVEITELEPAEQPIIPYTQLRTWFGELFDHDDVAFFLHTAAGGPTDVISPTQLHLIGLDRHIIGMVWLQ